MKKIAGLLILSFFQFYAYGQFKDVVVLNKGDSIACKIINISEGKIYYKMLTNDNVVDTYSKKDDVKAYYRNHTLFEYNKRTKGSSILDKNVLTERKSFYRKNVVGLDVIYIIPGLFYERRFPLAKKEGAIGLSLGAYFLILDEPIVDFEIKFIGGGPKHFYDVAIASASPIGEIFDKGGQLLYGTFSYQYVSRGGFLFKIAGGYTFGGWFYLPILKVGIGYNF